jgi:RNA polymerase sigma factor (sigma-70 family)
MTLYRLEKAAASPEDRFRAVFARHYEAVYRYAARRLGQDEAADAASEAFTIAWRKVQHIPKEPETLAWLYAVTRNVVSNVERGRRRRLRLAAKASAAHNPATPGADAATTVLAALDQLAPKERELLRLAAWEGLRPAEIGKVIGCSANAAAIRLYRARRRLEEAMNETGGMP